HAETVYIRARIEIFAFALLGRHIMRRAHYESRPCKAERLSACCLPQFCNAEIDYFDHFLAEIARLDHYVVRLQIAMNHARVVSGLDGFAYRLEDIEGALSRQHSEFLYLFAQRPSGQQLHCEIGAAVCEHAEIVYGDYIGMMQAGGCTGFPAE